MMSDLLPELSAMIARLTDCDPAGLDAESRFDEMVGWSSMQALTLMIGLEENWPIKLDLRRLMAVQTVGELADLVTEYLQRAESSR